MYVQGSEFGDTSYAEYQTGNQGKENIAFDKVSEGLLFQAIPHPLSGARSTLWSTST